MNGAPSVVAPARDCRHCTHLAGPYPGIAAYAMCGLDGDRRVQADARHGCSFWEREPGTDDDLDALASVTSAPRP